MQLSVKGDAKAILKDLKIVNKKIQVAATNRALNDANRAVHTRVVKALVASSGVPRRYFIGQRALTLKSGKERKQLKGIAKKYNSNFKTLKASTWLGLKKKIPVRAVKGWGTNKYTKKSLAGKSAADAFIARMPTGHEGVFIRSTRSRLPIQEVVFDFSEYGQELVEKVGNRVATKTFLKAFNREMKRRLNQKGNRAFRR